MTWEIFIGILLAIGFGTILKEGFLRFWKKRDDTQTVHATNEGKIIDADEKFQERILKRLEKVEGELKDVHERLTTQLVMNAEVKSENTHLKEKEKDHQAKIKELEEINAKQAIKIVNLENQVQSLETAHQIQKAQIEELDMKFNNLQLKRKTDKQQ